MRLVRLMSKPKRRRNLWRPLKNQSQWLSTYKALAMNYWHERRQYKRWAVYEVLS